METVRPRDPFAAELQAFSINHTRTETTPLIMAPQLREWDEWNARIHCKERALGESYSVLIFLGPVPAEQKEWRKSGSFVGMHGVYTGGGYGSGYGEGSNGPNEPGDDVTEGFVKLNQGLKAHGIDARSTAAVVAYLKENLDWRVQRVSFVRRCNTRPVLRSVFPGVRPRRSDRGDPIRRSRGHGHSSPVGSRG